MGSHSKYKFSKTWNFISHGLDHSIPPVITRMLWQISKMFSNLKVSRGLQSIFNISDIKNIVRVDQILILGLKSGARSQQLLSTVKIKTGKDGRVTKFRKIFK